MSRVPVSPVSSVSFAAYEPESGGTKSAESRVPVPEIVSGMSEPEARRPAPARRSRRERVRVPEVRDRSGAGHRGAVAREGECRGG